MADNININVTPITRTVTIEVSQAVKGDDGIDGVDGVVQTIVAGTNITVDSTDPANPIISSIGGGLAATDIDTLAELNAIVTDATLIDTTDARLSDARTPLAHTHAHNDTTSLQGGTTNEYYHLTAAEYAALGTGGGGAEYQYYDEKFYIDSTDATKWMRLQGSVTTMAYNTTTGLDLTSSPSTFVGAYFKATRFIGVANGNQTVANMTLQFGSINITNVTNVCILKVKMLQMASEAIEYATVLLESTVSLDITGYQKFVDTDFIETSISDGDILYVFFGANTLANIGHGNISIKCSID